MTGLLSYVPLTDYLRSTHDFANRGRSFHIVYVESLATGCRVGLAPPSVLQRLESRVREMVGRSGMREGFCVAWRPGTPAFWLACGGPASPHRRGRERDDWRTATTPMARRRPPPEPEKTHRNAVPRGLPGSAIVWIIPRSREVVPHNGVPGTPRCDAIPPRTQRLPRHAPM